MKTTAIILCILIAISISFQLKSQDQSKGQLWCCYEERIRPGASITYKELSRELVDFCKKEGFEHSFFTWETGDMSYQYWTPISSLDEVESIEKAWGALLQKWDVEKVKRISATKNSNFSKAVRFIPELDFNPDPSRLSIEEVNFEIWTEFCLIPGKMDEAREVIKEINQLLLARQYDDPWYWFEAGIGYETPCLIVGVLSKDPEDAASQQKVFEEVLGEEIRELRARFYQYVRKKKEVKMWYLRELSYQPAAE